MGSACRGSAGLEAGATDSASATMFSRSNSDPLISILSIRRRASPSSAHLGRAAPTRPPPPPPPPPVFLYLPKRSLPPPPPGSRDFLNSGKGVQRPPNGRTFYFFGVDANLTLQSLCRGCDRN